MLSVGTVIRERYVIRGLIGEGNSGAVYLVEDQRARRAHYRLFALKEVRGLTQQRRHQVIFEGVALRRLHHRALSHVYHVFNDDKHERVYVLMKYIEGPDLETLCQHQPEQCFSWPEVRDLIAPIIDAVRYLHQQQPPVFHRDIKPINIIVPMEGKTAVLVDFGIAKDVPVSSEQLDGENDIWLDIYGLGATCYMLLTGEEPPDVRLRLAQQSDPLEPANKVIPTIPAYVARAISQAMSLHPSACFSSVQQFWEALNASAPEQRPPPAPQKSSSASSYASVGPRSEKATEQSNTTSPQKQQAAELPPTRLSWKFVLALVVLTLLIGIGVGADFWPGLGNRAVRPSGTHALSTSTHLSLPTRSVTPPSSSPTALSASPAQTVTTYAGTLFDLAANTSTRISFTTMEQTPGPIRGYFTVMSNTQESGPLSGTVTRSKQVQFTVTNSAGQAMLFFEGALQSAGSWSGDYYSCRRLPGGSCHRAPGDYGIWNAVLAPSGS